jgi:hypothetical protein
MQNKVFLLELFVFFLLFVFLLFKTVSNLKVNASNSHMMRFTLVNASQSMDKRKVVGKVKLNFFDKANIFLQIDHVP